MLSKELLEHAGSILNEEQFSDGMYERIYNMFSDPSVSEIQKNNAKAKLKKELAVASSYLQVLSVLSVLLSIGIMASDEISSLFIGAVVLAYAAVYWFLLYPVIKKETYVLSVIEDVETLRSPR